jgi:hypothetical protein
VAFRKVQPAIEDCGSTKHFTTFSLTKQNKLFVPMRPEPVGLIGQLLAW